MPVDGIREDVGPVQALDDRPAGAIAGGRAGVTASDPTDFGQDVMNSIQSISQQPVEMLDLSTDPQSQSKQTANEKDMEHTAGPPKNESSQDTSVANPGQLSPLDSETEAVDSGIGPASDKPSVQRASLSSGPQLVITLLMHSTETRHPYIIDESYLKRRNVNVADNNPINLTVYTLKELILRDWRPEWESRPTSPTSIRLIHMGRMLDDKSYLKDSRFLNGDTPHIVHMTIKPQEAIDEEDARIAKGNTRDRDGSERSPGCRCLVM